MNLVVGITGASGAWAAKLLVERSQNPVVLVASKAGRLVYEQEVGDFQALEKKAAAVWRDDDLTAPIASGSVPTLGMVILPCSTNTLGKVAVGIADSLITRAAHCHLKEGRKLVLAVREAPWTLPNAKSAATVAAAGGTIMPISPPFYMFKGRDFSKVSVDELLTHYVDHLLSLFGQKAAKNWEDIR